MTVVGMDDAGFAAARDRLAAGEPIVIPTPSPLAYVLFADQPAAINVAKGRDPRQPVGVTPVAFDVVGPYLAVDPETARLIEWLMFDGLFSVLVPARPAPPGWLAPAVVEGVAAVAAAWMPQLRPLLGDRRFAYGSSANRTGSTPATDAAGADHAFDGDLLVIDGDHHRAAERRHGSTTTLAIGADGELSVHRHGIQDADDGAGEQRLLATLRARFVAAQERRDR